jgi:hypothetical protein
VISRPESELAPGPQLQETERQHINTADALQHLWLNDCRHRMEQRRPQYSRITSGPPQSGASAYIEYDVSLPKKCDFFSFAILDEFNCGRFIPVK